MLSVCIPVYNFHVTPLVEALSAQVTSLGVPAEIVLIDDGSENTFLELNEEVCGRCQYIRLGENVGRSAVRNLFPAHAGYDHLLFLDCDSVMISKSFLSDYVEAMQSSDHRVICGGRVYPGERPGRSLMLRWMYGVRRESRSAEERNRLPNRSFMTNNFLIHREVFSQVQFDERLTAYGHEDTLFGYRLSQLGIAVHHIDNPVLNGEMETNRVYLEKTRIAVSNLVRILGFVENVQEFRQEVKLLRAYERLGRKRQLFLLRGFYPLAEPVVKALLGTGYGGMRLFDLYKLGCLDHGIRRRSGEVTGKMI
jgi:glycosyltransferase involved in cell wall biosynthesis